MQKDCAFRAIKKLIEIIKRKSMSKKEVRVCVHIVLGERSKKFLDAFNKEDLIFRFPFALYIGFFSLWLMLRWCFWLDPNDDPFLNPEVDEDSIDD